MFHRLLSFSVLSYLHCALMCISLFLFANWCVLSPSEFHAISVPKVGLALEMGTCLLQLVHIRVLFCLSVRCLLVLLVSSGRVDKTHNVDCILCLFQIE